MGVTVDAADGRRWTVRRRFRWPRLRLIGPDEGHDWIIDLGAGLGALGFLVVVVAVVIFFLLPLFVFIIEAVLALAAVLILRGSWVIEAATADPPAETKTWKVHGPFRSRRALEEVASDLRAGIAAAPADAEPV